VLTANLVASQVKRLELSFRKVASGSSTWGPRPSCRWTELALVLLSTSRTRLPSGRELRPTWKKARDELAGEEDESPRWMIQSPPCGAELEALHLEATRFAVQHEPTRPPPGKTGTSHIVPAGARDEQAPDVGVHGAVDAMRPGRACSHDQHHQEREQVMVSLRDVSAPQTRFLVCRIEAQAPQEAKEVGPGRGDGSFVSEHLDEPGALLRGQIAASIRLFFSPPLTRSYTATAARLGLHRALHGSEGASRRWAEADLAAPSGSRSRARRRRDREHQHRHVDLALRDGLERGVPDPEARVCVQPSAASTRGHSRGWPPEIRDRARARLPIIGNAEACASSSC